jgi:hypothetical protein
MKALLLAALALMLALAAPARAVDSLTVDNAIQRLALARALVKLNPPRDAILESPLAQQPMFNEVFATVDESKLNETAATLMAEQFNIDELRALFDFQNSPAGKAIALKMPGYNKILGATLQNYIGAAFQQYVAHQAAGGNAAMPTAAPAMAMPGLPTAPAAPVMPAVPATMPAGLGGSGTPLK